MPAKEGYLVLIHVHSTLAQKNVNRALPLTGRVHCRLCTEFRIFPQYIMTTAYLQILHNKKECEVLNYIVREFGIVLSLKMMVTHSAGLTCFFLLICLHFLSIFFSIWLIERKSEALVGLGGGEMLFDKKFWDIFILAMFESMGLRVWNSWLFLFLNMMDWSVGILFILDLFNWVEALVSVGRWLLSPAPLETSSFICEFWESSNYSLMP